MGTVMVVGLLGGLLLGAAGTAQAQAFPSSGVMGGPSVYTASGQDRPVNTVPIAQFPAAGVDPPYVAGSVGVPTGEDLTIMRGRADATSPQIGQFPLAFMTQSLPSPISR